MGKYFEIHEARFPEDDRDDITVFKDFQDSFLFDTNISDAKPNIFFV